ncbi:MAG: hypothetical protein MUC50_10605, partial [Myxococcota bacterium]|nr:hypothetical protein [Myxococcota bacterium]
MPRKSVCEKWLGLDANLPQEERHQGTWGTETGNRLALPDVQILYLQPIFFGIYNNVMKKLALVAMPWNCLNVPNPSIGLLASVVRSHRADYDVKCY